MLLPPAVRKFALTVHVVCSVGWLGVAATFLYLAILAMTTENEATVRGVYLVMERAALYILLPFALASLLSGVVQSLGTTWGLFRHYWVLFKLVITMFATIILVIYLETFGQMRTVAEDSSAEIDLVRNFSPALHATLAIVLLLATTVLAISKPRGLTPYGQRKLRGTPRRS